MNRFRFAFSVCMLTLAMALPVCANGAVPPDLEIIADAGGLVPDGENVNIRISADGSARYTRYIPSTIGDPPIEENSFQLTPQQLEQLWQSIQDNDFFNLAPEHNAPATDDGAYVHLIVRANAVAHTVDAENIAVAALENIISVINSLTPAGNNLEYNIFPPVAFVPTDVCDSTVSTATSRLSAGVSKRDVLELSGSSRLSNEEELFTADFQAPAAVSPHPGTVVAYIMSLEDTVNRGIATLDAKGDFFGDQVSISVDNTANQTNKNLEVKLYLEFWGTSVTAGNVERIETAIENAWSGTTSDGASLTTVVHTRYLTDATAPRGTPGYHQIELTPSDSEKGTSTVRGRGDTFDVNSSVGSGTWATAGSTLNDTYAHEAGHLLGLPDRYIDYRLYGAGQDQHVWRRKGDTENLTTGELARAIAEYYPDKTEAELIAMLEAAANGRVTPHPNPEDLMDSLRGTPLQSDIDALAAQAGLLVNVRPCGVFVNKNMESQHFAITRSRDLFIPAMGISTLDGLYVACTDLEKDTPSLGERFDLAPSLDTWSEIEAAPLLCSLLRYIDQNELFCETEFDTQIAIWRITDNADLSENPEAEAILQAAGINLGDQTLDYPELINPAIDEPNTTFVTPEFRMKEEQGPADFDNDGVEDDVDNCTEVPNPDQRDTDFDFYGNVCDADLDNSGFVNFSDLALFRDRFGSGDPDADFDGSGFVNFTDLAIFRQLFGAPPGPSAFDMY